MKYFKNEQVPEEERRNVAFQAISAVRESVSIAQKQPQPITYEQTLDLIHDLNPEIYDQVVKLLKNKNESDVVKYFKDKADALSNENNKILPIDLIDKEIVETQDLLNKKPDKKFLKKRLIDLKGAKNHFTPREISEHKALNHDFYLAKRNFLTKPIYHSDSYKDYSLGNQRLLRLRLLHPDRDEVILGCDLIYEQFDLKNNKVRFVHLQYKVWDSNVLYFSSGSISQQLEKIKTSLCDEGYCVDNMQTKKYRFPHCSGFLRPTTPLLNGESKLVTTGIHLPVCEVLKIRDTHKKLSRENAKDLNLTNKVFEELFNCNFLGSRWISIDELDDLYIKRGIKSLTENIRIHAQEIIKDIQEE